MDKMINKTVLFIKTPVPMLKDDRLEPDMGMLYCASYVKKHCNVDVVYVDLSVDDKSVLMKYLDNCSIYCFSSFTANYHLTKQIVEELRKVALSDSVFIVGGHHATALPNEVSNDFDYVITGEGELAEAELISLLIEGKKPETKIIKGKCIENLDDAGWIDYTLVDLDKYTRKVKGQKSISILTSRGCPYRCEFCNSTLMREYKTVRFRSAKDVVSEILYLYHNYNYTSFRIQDDIFSINRKRLTEIANSLEGYNFSFRCFARVDNIDEEILLDFKRMGIFHLSFGVESGSQKILNLMNKGTKVEDIRHSIKLAKEYGMKCRVYLIAGYPGETIETLDETISLIKEVKPDDVSVYPLIPYPGTPLFANPSKYGIVNIDKDFSKYYQIYGDKQSGYVFETNDMDLDKLKFFRDYLVKGIADVCPWAIDDEENR
ncbi:MAG TPA: hypothetical protein DHV89_11570 [Ruminococcus sp.]|nr:hypothetical protein [Ruminococcus sp.]